MAVVVHNFTTSDWELLSSSDERVIVYNPSGKPVDVVATTSDQPPVIDDDLEIIQIGGFYNEYIGLDDSYVWAKCLVANGFVRVRPYGTVDPESDVTQLGTALNETRTKLDEHIFDTDNPHNLDKDDVGLGHIPNIVSDNIDYDESASLATSRAVFNLNEKVDTHLEDMANPHQTTKNHVGLGNVQNFPMATSTKAVDADDWASYMSPASTAIAISQLAEVAYSLTPQCVVAGPTAPRPSGWNFTECDAPTKLVDVVIGKDVKINAGLQVSFACDHKARLSIPLASDLTITLPPEMYSLFYIYVNLSKNGTILSAGATNIQPQVGEYKEGNLSDFFNISNCMMYDIDNNSIQRVYIAKAFMSGSTVASIVSAPLGKNHILPIPVNLNQNERYLTVNPFIEHVDVKTEVFYNSTWGDPGWNDQTGIKGNKYPSDPMNKLIVQSGLMGLIACGQESGSSFGLTFPTVTVPVRTRLVLSKQFK